MILTRVLRIVFRPRHKPNRWKRVSIIGCVTALVLPVKKCSTKTKLQHHDVGAEMNFDKLLKLACTSTVNSTSEVLTSLFASIMDSSSEYRYSLQMLTKHIEKCIELSSTIPYDDQNEDDIIEARNDVQEKKIRYMELMGLLEYAEKLTISSAEFSYLVGAESLSVSLTERLYSIQQMIKKEQNEVEAIERECLLMQEILVKNMGKK